ncbi:MAG TPA: cytochrome c [Rhodopila sp.]|jgi:mono/diheme cytochrome c family protein|nr:cytochrome c [Rhodopila sp.]
MRHRIAATAVATLAALSLATAASAADPQVARGQYLVQLGGCNDCHTPGHFTGHPDMARYLGGSDVGFGIPGLGVFAGPNLTPDEDTGLGRWTIPQIVTAITTGVRPDGRILAPAMPWRDFANLTQSDAQAIALFLKSLPPTRNKVAGPFGPTEPSTTPVMAVIPGSVYASQIHDK